MAQPDKIGKYQIVKELGKGAMGMVYEGFDPGIERRVAIKTILPEYLKDAESEEAWFQLERISKMQFSILILSGTWFLACH